MAETTTMLRARTGLRVDTVDDLLRVADILYKGGCTPKGIDNPVKVAAVILAGQEVGLAPTQALSSIMLQNGRYSVYGDGAMALVRASGLLEAIEEWVEGEGDARTGHCKGERKGEPGRHYTFSMADARKAGLVDRSLGKNGQGAGPWVSYPDRMLVMRARGFFFKDHFPDVLKGMLLAEEAQDLDDGPRVVQVQPADAPAAIPPPPPAIAVAVPFDNGMAVSVAPVPPAPADPPVTAEQLEEIVTIREMMLNSLSERGPESDAAAWKNLLAPYGTESARAFTAAQAAAFLAAEGPKWDPFGHPSATSPS